MLLNDNARKLCKTFYYNKKLKGYCKGCPEDFRAKCIEPNIHTREKMDKNTQEMNLIAEKYSHLIIKLGE